MNPTTFLTTIYFKILTNCPFLIDAIGDFFGGVGDFFANDVADFFTNLPQTILDGIQKGILTAVGWLLYLLTIAILRVFRVICSLFNVFSGIDNVTYKGEYTRLINVFFENTYVNYVYKGMLIIGIVMCIGFTIAAVIRKMFDSNDKQEVPLGGIILNALKAMLIMLLMTFIVTATINITNTLIQRVSLLFDYSMNGGGSEKIVFTDQDFAAMGRVYNTIGNYSVNPSYESRYNINSCFNEIRGELNDMKERGLFELNYVTRDSSGNEIDTWQSVLQKIVLAAPLDNNLNIDVYNPSVTNAILYAMEKLRNDPGFEPLKSYTLMNDVWGADVLDLDTVLFLMGTAEAALNSDYNIRPAMDDAVRGPYFTGEKSIYSMTDVYESFNMEIGGVSYFTIIITSIAAIWQMALIILNCAQRIFSMLVMYLISPPIVAVMPFDNGAKFKQWVNAFIVQAFGVLGQVVAMRVLMLFIPVVMSSDLDLKLGGSLDFLGVFNFVGKAILIICILISCRKVSDIINGILADNGGGAAAQMENYLGGGLGNQFEGKLLSSFLGGGSGGSGGGGNGGGDGDEDKEEDNDTPDKANVISVGGDKGGDDDGGGDSQRSSTQQKKEFFDNMKKSESERSADTIGQTADVVSHPIDSINGKKGSNGSKNEGGTESKNESNTGSKSGGNSGGGNSSGGNSGGNSHKPAIAPPSRNNSGKNQNLNPKIFGPSVGSGGSKGKGGSNGGSGNVSNRSTSPFSGYKSPDSSRNNQSTPASNSSSGSGGSSSGSGNSNGGGSGSSGGSSSNRGSGQSSGSGNSSKPKFDIYGRDRVSSGNSGSVSNKSTSPFSSYKSPDGSRNSQSTPASNSGSGSGGNGGSSSNRGSGQSSTDSETSGSDSADSSPMSKSSFVDINAPYGDNNSSSQGTPSKVESSANEGSVSENGGSGNSSKPKFDIYGRDRVSNGNDGNVSNRSASPFSGYKSPDSSRNDQSTPASNSGSGSGSSNGGESSNGGGSSSGNSPKQGRSQEYQYRDPVKGKQSKENNDRSFSLESGMKYDENFNVVKDKPKQGSSREYQYRDPVKSKQSKENNDRSFSLESGMKYDENFNVVKDNDSSKK